MFRNRLVVVALAALALALTGCKPLGPVSGAPVTSTAPSASAPADPGSAEKVLGWKRIAGGDEFNGTLDKSKWGVYQGAGHAGNGKRVANAVSVSNGSLKIKGDANGNSGGISYKTNANYQRWEARIRIPQKGDHGYSAVFLLWVQNNSDFPCKGEIDPFEHRTDGTTFGSFLHYSCANKQSQSKTEFNPQQWNNIAVERVPGAVRYFLNGKQVFEDTAASHQPQGPYHPTFQLDLFEGAGGQTPSVMEVDYLRQFAV
jgi:hypothetical protein